MDFTGLNFRNLTFYISNSRIFRLSQRKLLIFVSVAIEDVAVNTSAKRIVMGASSSAVLQML